MSREPVAVENLPELTTVDEARSVLRVSKTLLYEMVRSEQLHALRIGRLIRIRRSELERLVRGEDA